MRVLDLFSGIGGFGLTTNRGFTMNEVARPPRIPAITAEQRIRIRELIAAGHTNDLVIAQHTGVMPEQVEAIRRDFPLRPTSRKKPPLGGPDA